MEWILYLTAGVLTGVLSGIFGIGGGIVLVPILVTLFAMPQATAGGTSLVAMLLPVGALGVWEYYRSGRIGPNNIACGLVIACGITIGTFLGARIAVNISETLLRRAFAIFLFTIAARFWFVA